MSSMKLQHRVIVQKGVHVNSSKGSSVTKESMQTVIVKEHSYIKFNIQEVMMTRVNRYSQTYEGHSLQRRASKLLHIVILKFT